MRLIKDLFAFDFGEVSSLSWPCVWRMESVRCIIMITGLIETVSVRECCHLLYFLTIFSRIERICMNVVFAIFPHYLCCRDQHLLQRIKDKRLYTTIIQNDPREYKTVQGLLQRPDWRLRHFRCRHYRGAELEERSHSSTCAGDGWVEDIYFTSVGAYSLLFTCIIRVQEISTGLAMRAL